MRRPMLILDPPRTGMSEEALTGAVRLRARKWFTCRAMSPRSRATVRRLVEAGYSLARPDAFDMFPNTPHVEVVAVFTL